MRTYAHVERASWQRLRVHAATLIEVLKDGAASEAGKGMARASLFGSALFLAPVLLILGGGLNLGPMPIGLTAICATFLFGLTPSHCAAYTESFTLDAPHATLPLEPRQRRSAEALATWTVTVSVAGLLLLPLVFLGPMFASEQGTGSVGRVMSWAQAQPGLSSPSGVLASGITGSLVLLGLNLNVAGVRALGFLRALVLPSLGLALCVWAFPGDSRLALFLAALVLIPLGLRRGDVPVAVRDTPVRSYRGATVRSGLPAERRLLLDVLRSSLITACVTVALPASVCGLILSLAAWCVGSLPVDSRLFEVAEQLLAGFALAPLVGFFPWLVILLGNFGRVAMAPLQVGPSRLSLFLGPDPNAARPRFLAALTGPAWQRLPIGREHLAFASTVAPLTIGLVWALGLMIAATLIEASGGTAALWPELLLCQALVGGIIGAALQSIDHREGVARPLGASIVGIASAVTLALAWHAGRAMAWDETAIVGGLLAAAAYGSACLLLLSLRVPRSLLGRARRP